MKYDTPSDFVISFSKISFLTFKLTTVQTIPLPKERTFKFFQDPCNLPYITPPWLDFKMKDCSNWEVYEGAEFEYSIRVFGFRMSWRSKILDYKPSDYFSDVQLIGPYDSWIHIHLFEERDKKTIMKDIVTYKLPFYALLLHFIIKERLRDIFCYRSYRIKLWAEKEAKRLLV
ncbi:MAG: SRPBCC family protein [Thermodesulfovibrionales bacterium]|nr:SRPBCC family protein [Thermodesulfovibrionales bacterium]